MIQNVCRNFVEKLSYSSVKKLRVQTGRYGFDECRRWG